jgi:hypothetical protein
VITRSFLILVALGLWVNGAHAASGDVSIDSLLVDVQTVLVKVRDAADVEDLPVLKSVTLTISAGLTRSADGSLRFHVLEAGAEASGESAQELLLDLGPPEPADKSPVSIPILPLADAIINAARDVRKAASREPPLHLHKLEASVEFTVEKSASGSLLFMGAKVGTRNAQKIVLRFGE